jgi:hypothetical protein
VHISECRTDHYLPGRLHGSLFPNCLLGGYSHLRAKIPVQGILILRSSAALRRLNGSLRRLAIDVLAPGAATTIAHSSVNERTVDETVGSPLPLSEPCCGLSPEQLSGSDVTPTGIFGNELRDRIHILSCEIDRGGSEVLLRMFSLDVQCIESMTGERWSSHAKAICSSVARCLLRIRSRTALN